MNKHDIWEKIRTTTVIRALCAPYLIVRGLIKDKAYTYTEDSKYFASLKNKHKGQRCFIIGNGPSLRVDDLEKIKNEITFGANAIYNIYPKTSWRPTYYLRIDINTLPYEIDAIKNAGTYPKYMDYLAKKYRTSKYENIWFMNFKYMYSLKDPIKSPIKAKTLSSDLSKYATRLGTVTAHSIELAIYMGFSTIYLLGVDNNYRQKMGNDGKLYIDESVNSSYFEGMKDIDGTDRERKSGIQYMNRHEKSYELCKEFALKHNVEIINLTRGGKLETFRRMNFDDVI